MGHGRGASHTRRRRHGPCAAPWPLLHRQGLEHVPVSGLGPPVDADGRHGGRHKGTGSGQGAECWGLQSDQSWEFASHLASPWGRKQPATLRAGSQARENDTYEAGEHYRILARQPGKQRRPGTLHCFPPPRRSRCVGLPRSLTLQAGQTPCS